MPFFNAAFQTHPMKGGRRVKIPHWPATVILAGVLNAGG